MKNMKARLTIEVEYEADAYSDRKAMEGDILVLLQDAADHLAGEGLLTGDTALTVDNWSSVTKIIKR